MNAIQTAGGPTSVRASDVDEGSSPTAAGATPGLLPEPAPLGFSSDAMTAIAMLMTRADEQQRETDVAASDQQNEAAQQATDDQVAALRDQATQDVYGALATGGLEIAGGACTAGAGFTGARAGEGSNAVLTGLGQIAPGIGTLGASPFKCNSEQDGATAAAQSAAAQAAGRSAQSSEGAAQDDDSAIDKVQQYLQSLLDAQAQTGSAAASVLRG